MKESLLNQMETASLMAAANTLNEEIETRISEYEAAGAKRDSEYVALEQEREKILFKLSYKKLEVQTLGSESVEESELSALEAECDRFINQMQVCKLEAEKEKTNYEAEIEILCDKSDRLIEALKFGGEDVEGEEQPQI